MDKNTSTWALVLAAGQGSRLSSLTTTSNGLAVPKQFCSLQGGPSLLQEALQRAAAVAPAPRICTIVAAQHGRWWYGPLHDQPATNVIVQPENRGTAHGVLLSLLHIAARDPQATLVLLPADHHVQDEVVLAQSLRQAAVRAAAHPDTVFLLGVEPESADTELGYIVPDRSKAAGSAARVLRFVEKPALPQARELLARGALWNAFIVAGTVRALLSLYDAKQANTVRLMRDAVARDRREGFCGAAIAALYQTLPVVDFSRAVLEGQEARLSVLPVPHCGWTDLGTPQRVAETLQRLPRGPRLPTTRPLAMAHLSLAAQHSRTQLRTAASAS